MTNQSSAVKANSAQCVCLPSPLEKVHLGGLGCVSHTSSDKTVPNSTSVWSVQMRLVKRHRIQLAGSVLMVTMAPQPV